MSMHPELETLLRHMSRIDASDLYLTVGSPPVFRVSGVGHPGRAPLEQQPLADMITASLSDDQQRTLSETLELNFAVVTEDEQRFRVNVFRQRGALGLVARRIKTEIPDFDELALPEVLRSMALAKRGLVLLVGSTGSGKSTTLAAMIGARNAAASGHIVTVEDPIEFMHPHNKCIVTQREVGVDTLSYQHALQNALRQAPDVILIGEIRDQQTMAAAIEFAETGHLCMSTLHSNNASQAVERILNFFPPSRHQEIRLQLSLNLRAVVSQRLIRATGGGRAAALEIMLDTPRIRELIKRGEVDALPDAMEQSRVDGCATFDTALLELALAGRITTADALDNADRPNDLRLRLQQALASAGQPWDEQRQALRLVEPAAAAG